MNKKTALVILAVICVIVGGAGSASYISRHREQSARQQVLYEQYLQQLAEEEANATPEPGELKRYTVYTDSFESVLREPSKDCKDEVCKVASGSIVEYLGEEENGYMKVQMIGTDQQGWLPSYALKSAFSYSLSELTIVDADSEGYTYAEFEEDIVELVEKYPYTASYSVIGTTSEGRDIYDLVIGDTNAEQSVLITAGWRGSEIITSILLMKQAEYYAHYIAEGVYDDIPYLDVFENVNFHIVAMANPDGLSLSLGGVDGITDTETKERVLSIYENDRLKNNGSNIRYKYFNQWEANTDGVDVSRNFPTDDEWASAHTEPSYSGYMDTALSSPEAKAIWQLLSKHSFTCVVQYQTVGESLEFRYDPNDETSVQTAELAIALADLTLYDINIEPEDWQYVGSLYDATEKQLGISAFAVNLGSAEMEKPISFSELQLMWLKFRESWMVIGAELLGLE